MVDLTPGARVDFRVAGLRDGVLLKEGQEGNDGRSVESISRTSGSGNPGQTDTYTITYSDATTSTFQIYNGTNGLNGRSIVSVTRTSGNGAAGTVDTYTITFDSGSPSTFTVTNGANGINGRSVDSITRTSGTGAAGTTDTYTISYSDGSSSTFQVVNGANGQGVPVGGATGTFLRKTSATDYATEWYVLPSDAAAATPSLRSLGTGTTNAAAGNRGLITGGTAGQVLRKTSSTDYAVEWATPVSGGGTLNKLKYGPTQGQFQTTGTSYADVDATNLVLTFTPTSTSVWITLAGTCDLSAGVLFWGLRSGSAFIAGSNTRVVSNGAAIASRSVDILVTGLTIGTPLTYKWAWRVISATTNLYYGVGAEGDAYGPLTMEARAA